MNSDYSDGPLLVFGATGATGVEICRHAVSLGYSVNAFARDPDKGAEKLGSIGGEIRVIEGDALDAAAVETAFHTQPCAVVLALGMYQARAGGDTLTRATRNIVAAMHQHDVRRLLNISSLGVGENRLQGNFMARLVQRTTLKHTLADKELQEALLRESGLDVTNIRPSRLMNDNGPKAWQAWEGEPPKQPLIWSVNRSDVAIFALQCLRDPQSIDRSFAITGSKN